MGQSVRPWPLTLTFERPLKQKNQWSAANARKEAAAKQKRRNGQLKNMLLVKWKDQPYKLATWEFEEDINDDLKVSRFRTNQIPPTNFQTALQKTKSAALQLLDLSFFLLAFEATSFAAFVTKNTKPDSVACCFKM